MRRIPLIILLQIYAVLLACAAYARGMVTDEAKYLLNIPYPHPPGMRFIFSLFHDLPGHELFWRIIMATLVVQSVWLVVLLARRIYSPAVMWSGLLYLASAAVVMQAGTLLMSVVNALQGFVLLTCALTAHRKWPQWAWILIGMFWLWSLFSGYQAVLYLPLVFMIYHRSPLKQWERGICIVMPLVLLVLYTLTNPLALDRIVHASGKDVSLPIGTRVSEYLMIWGMASSWVLSVLGTIGIILSRRMGLILTFILVSAYIFLSHQPYYAILLTPLLITGYLFLSQNITIQQRFIAIPALIFMIWFSLMTLQAQPTEAGTAKALSRILPQQVPQDSTMIITGSFGHEWQYYLPYIIRKYDPGMKEKDADIVICRPRCEDGELMEGKRKIEVDIQDVEVYVR